MNTHAHTVDPMRLKPDRVVSAREARGWTQQQLSAHSGVSQATVSRIEAGESGGSASAQHAIAKALGVTEAWLRGDDTPGPQPSRQLTTHHAHDAPEVLDAALGAAYDSSKHTVADLVAVRTAMGEVDLRGYTPAELVRAVSVWLNAAASLREDRTPVSAGSLLVRSTTRMMH